MRQAPGGRDDGGGLRAARRPEGGAVQRRDAERQARRRVHAAGRDGGGRGREVRALGHPVRPMHTRTRGTVPAYLRAETDVFSRSGTAGGLHQIAADTTIRELLAEPRRKPVLCYSAVSDHDFSGVASRVA